MERLLSKVRPIRMMSPRQVRGTVLAVLLCSALAGCGSVVASAPAAGSGSSPAASSAGATSSGSASAAAAGSASPASSAAAVAAAAGCSDVSQATSVSVHRVLHLVEPTRLGSLSKTQHDTTLVRALYSQLCAAITHPAKIKGTLRCPANLGISYAGTFYDGSRPLATFVYGASGCQTASLSAAGKTKTTLMVGSAAAAAPKLQADLAKALGLPSLVTAQPKPGTGTPRNGGPVR
jgi:pilus assembly protein FimV